MVPLLCFISLTSALYNSQASLYVFPDRNDPLTKDSTSVEACQEISTDKYVQGSVVKESG